MSQLLLYRTKHEGNIILAAAFFDRNITRNRHNILLMLSLVHGENIIAATCFPSVSSKRYDIKLGKNAFLSKKHTLRHCLFKTKIRLFCKHDINFWGNGAITRVKMLLKWFDFILLGSSLAAILFLIRRFAWSAVLPAKKTRWISAPAEFRQKSGRNCGEQIHMCMQCLISYNSN